MNSLLILIFVFVIIAIFTHMIVVAKERKTGRKAPEKKMYQKTIDQININRELRKIEEDRPLYAIPEKIIYKRSDAIHPANEGIIRWNKAFLRSLEWKRYEEVCMEYLKIKNCAASVTCTGADGGIDIKIHDNNGTLFAIAQCKSWSKPIGVNLIRELYGVMASDKVKYGIFLTTSVFTTDALEFAKDKTLILIDADEFVDLINNLEDSHKRRIDQIATEGDYSTPTCVHCNVKMVKRTATKGKNAGHDFWGCINFPKCRKVMFVKG